MSEPSGRALIVAAVLAMISCGSGASTSGGGAPAATVTGSGWATIATFNGDGTKDTAPFTVHGWKARFVYTVQPNSSGPVPFLWQMFRQGTPVGPTNSVGRDSCATCDGQQTNELGGVPAAATTCTW